MNTKLARSLTAISFSALIALSVAGATENSKYGTAPASLDFPSGSSSAEEPQTVASAAEVKKNSANREELQYLADSDPFPSKSVALVDPITKQSVENAAVGPAFRARGYADGFDYYRYVTFYDVSLRKERFYELPIQRAECYEKSDIFANYTSSQTFTATVSATASLKMLGLTASITRSKTLGTGHGVTATGGIVADYTPYILFHDWNGETYVQLLNSKTGQTKFLDKPTDRSPWWVFVIMPTLAHAKYPMDFSIKGADKTFMVDRDIIQHCVTSFGSH
jgi:hypothetical protein